MNTDILLCIFGMCLATLVPRVCSRYVVGWTRASSIAGVLAVFCACFRTCRAGHAGFGACRRQS